MPYTLVRGVRLYFEEHGSGPCLIVAHGMLGSVGMAAVVNAARLAKSGLRVLLFDGAQLPLDRLPEIQAPTLIFGHPGDVMHPLRSAELLAAGVPGASLQVAPSAEHWKQNADQFSELVAAFVKADSSR